MFLDILREFESYVNSYFKTRIPADYWTYCSSKAWIILFHTNRVKWAESVEMTLFASYCRVHMNESSSKCFQMIVFPPPIYQWKVKIICNILTLFLTTLESKLVSSFSHNHIKFGLNNRLLLASNMSKEAFWVVLLHSI